jgi:hypothetical protein
VYLNDTNCDSSAEQLKQLLRTKYKSCVEENARELLEEEAMKQTIR